MKKSIAGLVMLASLILGLAAPAGAQGPSLNATPGSIEAPGSLSLTVTGSNFTDDGFLLPCPGADGDPAKMGADSCDTAALTPYTTGSDGSWSASVTYDIPAEGLVIVAGNAAQTENAVFVIAIGVSELPNTGANTMALLFFAVAMLGGGAVLVSKKSLLETS